MWNILEVDSDASLIFFLRLLFAFQEFGVMAVSLLDTELFREPKE